MATIKEYGIKISLDNGDFDAAIKIQQDKLLSFFTLLDTGFKSPAKAVQEYAQQFNKSLDEMVEKEKGQYKSTLDLMKQQITEQMGLVQKNTKEEFDLKKKSLDDLEKATQDSVKRIEAIQNQKTVLPSPTLSNKELDKSFKDASKGLESSLKGFKAPVLEIDKEGPIKDLTTLNTVLINANKEFADRIKRSARDLSSNQTEIINQGEANLLKIVQESHNKQMADAAAFQQKRLASFRGDTVQREQIEKEYYSRIAKLESENQARQHAIQSTAGARRQVAPKEKEHGRIGAGGKLYELGEEGVGELGKEAGKLGGIASKLGPIGVGVATVGGAMMLAGEQAKAAAEEWDHFEKGTIQLTNTLGKNNEEVEKLPAALDEMRNSTIRTGASFVEMQKLMEMGIRSAPTLKSNVKESVAFAEDAYKLSVDLGESSEQSANALLKLAGATGVDIANQKQRKQLMDEIVVASHQSGTSAEEMTSKISKGAIAYRELSKDQSNAAVPVLALNNLFSQQGLDSKKSQSGIEEIGKALSDTETRTKLIALGLQGVDKETGKVKDWSVVFDSLGKGAEKFESVLKGKATPALQALASNGGQNMKTIMDAFKQGEGAADEAFENMAESSEVLDKRWDAAYKNVLLGFGKTSNSAFDAVKEAGVGMLEWIGNVFKPAEQAAREHTAAMEKNVDIVHNLTGTVGVLGTVLSKAGTEGRTTGKDIDAAFETVKPVIASLGPELKDVQKDLEALGKEPHNVENLEKLRKKLEEVKDVSAYLALEEAEKAGEKNIDALTDKLEGLVNKQSGFFTHGFGRILAGVATFGGSEAFQESSEGKAAGATSAIKAQIGGNEAHLASLQAQKANTTDIKEQGQLQKEIFETINKINQGKRSLQQVDGAINKTVGEQLKILTTQAELEHRKVTEEELQAAVVGSLGPIIAGNAAENTKITEEIKKQLDGSKELIDSKEKERQATEDNAKILQTLNEKKGKEGGEVSVVDADTVLKAKSLAEVLKDVNKTAFDNADAANQYRGAQTQILEKAALELEMQKEMGKKLDEGQEKQLKEIQTKLNSIQGEETKAKHADEYFRAIVRATEAEEASLKIKVAAGQITGEEAAKVTELLEKRKSESAVAAANAELADKRKKYLADEGTQNKIIDAQLQVKSGREVLTTQQKAIYLKSLVEENATRAKGLQDEVKSQALQLVSLENQKLSGQLSGQALTDLDAQIQKQQTVVANLQAQKENYDSISGSAEKQMNQLDVIDKLEKESGVVTEENRNAIIQTYSKEAAFQSQLIAMDIARLNLAKERHQLNDIQYAIQETEEKRKELAAEEQLLVKMQARKELYSKEELGAQQQKVVGAQTTVAAGENKIFQAQEAQRHALAEEEIKAQKFQEDERKRLFDKEIALEKVKIDREQEALDKRIKLYYELQNEALNRMKAEQQLSNELRQMINAAQAHNRAAVNSIEDKTQSAVEAFKGTSFADEMQKVFTQWSREFNEKLINKQETTQAMIKAIEDKENQVKANEKIISDLSGIVSGGKNEIEQLKIQQIGVEKEKVQKSGTELMALNETLTTKMQEFNNLAKGTSLSAAQVLHPEKYKELENLNKAVEEGGKGRNYEDHQRDLQELNATISAKNKEYTAAVAQTEKLQTENRGLKDQIDRDVRKGNTTLDISAAGIKADKAEGTIKVLSDQLSKAVGVIEQLNNELAAAKRIENPEERAQKIGIVQTKLESQIGPATPLLAQVAELMKQATSKEQLQGAGFDPAHIEKIQASAGKLANLNDTFIKQITVLEKGLGPKIQGTGSEQEKRRLDIEASDLNLKNIVENLQKEFLLRRGLTHQLEQDRAEEEAKNIEKNAKLKLQEIQRDIKTQQDLGGKFADIAQNPELAALKLQETQLKKNLQLYKEYKEFQIEKIALEDATKIFEQKKGQFDLEKSIADIGVTEGERMVNELNHAEKMTAIEKERYEKELSAMAPRIKMYNDIVNKQNELNILKNKQYDAEEEIVKLDQELADLSAKKIEIEEKGGTTPVALTNRISDINVRKNAFETGDTSKLEEGLERDIGEKKLEERRKYGQALTEQELKQINDRGIQVNSAEKDMRDKQKALMESLSSVSYSSYKDMAKNIKGDIDKIGKSLDEGTTQGAAGAIAGITNITKSAVNLTKQTVADIQAITSASASGRTDLAIEAGGKLQEKIGEALLNSGVPGLDVAGAVLLGTGFITEAIGEMVGAMNKPQATALQNQQLYEVTTNRITQDMQTQLGLMNAMASAGAQTLQTAQQKLAAENKIIDAMHLQQGKAGNAQLMGMSVEQLGGLQTTTQGDQATKQVLLDQSKINVSISDNNKSRIGLLTEMQRLNNAASQAIESDPSLSMAQRQAKIDQQQQDFAKLYFAVSNASYEDIKTQLGNMQNNVQAGIESDKQMSQAITDELSSRTALIADQAAVFQSTITNANAAISLLTTSVSDQSQKIALLGGEISLYQTHIVNSLKDLAQTGAINLPTDLASYTADQFKTYLQNLMATNQDLTPQIISDIQAMGGLMNQQFEAIKAQTAEMMSEISADSTAIDSKMKETAAARTHLQDEYTHQLISDQQLRAGNDALDQQDIANLQAKNAQIQASVPLLQAQLALSQKMKEPLSAQMSIQNQISDVTAQIAANNNQIWELQNKTTLGTQQSFDEQLKVLDLQKSQLTNQYNARELKNLDYLNQTKAINDQEVAVLQNKLNYLVSINASESDRLTIENQIYAIQHDQNLQQQLALAQTEDLNRQRNLLVIQNKLGGVNNTAQIQDLQNQIIAILKTANAPAQQIQAQIQTFQQTFPTFATGGETEEGLAYLHDDEIVLNKKAKAAMNAFAPGLLSQVNQSNSPMDVLNRMNPFTQKDIQYQAIIQRGEQMKAGAAYQAGNSSVNNTSTVTFGDIHIYPPAGATTNAETANAVITGIQRYLTGRGQHVG